MIYFIGLLAHFFNEGCEVISHERMAYIARLRNLQLAVPSLTGATGAAPLVPARGDKWYIDPEEVRQYDAPAHIKWSGAWPYSAGPNWEHFVFMNKNSMYPRMPYYQRQLKNPYIKYDEGINGRKNVGETYHIMEVITIKLFAHCAILVFCCLF